MTGSCRTQVGSRQDIHSNWNYCKASLCIPLNYAVCPYLILLNTFNCHIVSVLYCAKLHIFAMFYIWILLLSSIFLWILLVIISLVDLWNHLELARFQRKCFNMDLETGTLDSLKVSQYGPWTVKVNIDPRFLKALLNVSQLTRKKVSPWTLDTTSGVNGPWRAKKSKPR